MSENNHEQLRLLVKVLRSPIFRFVIVRYNGMRTLIEQVIETVHTAYPERKTIEIHTQKHDYRTLMDTLYQHQGAIVYLLDFDKLVNNDDMVVGFNQRRDKLAELNLSIIAFVRTKESIQNITRKLPDLWSFRSLILELKTTNTIKVRGDGNIVIQDINNSTITTNTYEEYDSLIKRLEELPINIENLALLSTTYERLFDICEALGKYKEGLEFAKQYYEIATEFEFEKKNKEEFANSLDRLGRFYQDLGEYKKAKSLLKRNLRFNIENNLSNISESQNNLGCIYLHLRNYEKAKELLEKALQLAIESFGENHTILAIRQNNLAVVYANLENYEKAIELHEKALQTTIEIFGEKHPNVASNQSNLGLVYDNLGEYEKAKKLHKKALQSDLENFGEKHPTVAIRKSNLAWGYFNTNQKEKALELWESAYQISLESLGENHPQTQHFKSFIDENQQ